MATLLAGDIGGTKTLLSLHSGDGDPAPLVQQRYGSADWPDLASMVRHFLAEVAPGQAPAAACFAVAGPVQGGRARLTNLDWDLAADALADACGIPLVELVNDFAVLVHGLPHLQPQQQEPIRPGVAVPDAPTLILGAGTGLGVAIGIPGEHGPTAVASEAAHGEFAPRTEAEWELKQWLARDLALDRISIERVVSGTGLGHVARWLLHREHPDGDHPLWREAGAWEEVRRRERQGLPPGPTAADGPEPASADLPAAVAAAAKAGDPLAGRALHLWIEAYGSVTGDLALGCLARGGIWLAGGTAAKLLESLRSPLFEEALLAKGRLRPVLESIPVKALVDPAVGTFSAACRARSLLEGP